MSTPHANFLRDLAVILREHAYAASEKEATRPGGAGDASDFDAGRAFAYYEVLSLLINQAKAFGIPAADLGLDGFEPESLLRPAHRPPPPKSA